MGELYRAQGEFQKAEESFRKALGISPGDDKVHAALGDLYRVQGKFQEAEQEVKKAIEIAPTNDRAQLCFGEICRIQGRLPEAEAAFKRVLEIRPGFCLACVELGELYRAQDRFVEAAAAFKKAIEIDPQNAGAYYRLGQIHRSQGRLTEAETAFQKSLGIDPGDDEAWAELGELYRVQDKFREAAETFEKAIAINPRNAGAHFHLGEIHRSQGRLAEAEAAFQKSLEIDPRDDEAWAELGELYRVQDKFREAVEAFEKAIAINPKNDGAHFHLGEIHRSQGRLAEAEAAFQKSVEINPRDDEAWAELGELYRVQDKPREAVEAFEKVIAINPKDAGAHFRLGKIHRSQGRLAEAEAALKKAIAISPDNDEAQFCLGQIQHIQGKLSEAEAAFKRALAINPGVSAHLSLARIYKAKRQYRLAEDEFKKALELDPAVIKTYRELIDLHIQGRNVSSAMAPLIKATELFNEQDFRENQGMREAVYLKTGKRLGPGQKLQIKIIRTPFFVMPREAEITHSLLLPLGMAQIVSYLRQNGMPIVQDDLDAKIHCDNRFARLGKGIDEAVFFDERRILEYSSGKDDPDIEAVMNRVEDKSQLSGPAVILLSVPEWSENPSAILFLLAYAKYIKTKYHPQIIIGGFDGRFHPLIQANAANIDFIIRGDGEKKLFKLLLAIENGLAPNEIPGLSLGDDGKTIIDSHSDAAFVAPDFTGLPMDAYGYRNIRRYDQWDSEAARDLGEFNDSRITIAPLIQMKGCPYRCIFCCASVADFTHALSVEKAVSWLREIKARHRIDKFLFLNSTLNVSKEYVHALCDGIIKADLNIMWSDSARADMMDKDLLLKLRKAGCIRLLYGMETASPSMLRYVDKRISPKHLEEIIRWTDEAGIWVGLQSIIGFPHEKAEDIEMTVDFIKRNRAHINTVYYNIFTLREESRMYREARECGIDRLSGFDHGHHERKGLLAYATIRYDEIGGLKWEDKLKQSIANYDYFLAQTQGGDWMPFFEREHFLFFLYSKYRDKRRVVAAYEQAGKQWPLFGSLRGGRG